MNFMDLKPGESIMGTRVDVAFLGSCTNSRISDLREGARLIKGNKVHPSVRMLVVPGSQQVKQQAEEEGLHEIFTEAGAEWREAGVLNVSGHEPGSTRGSGEKHFLLESKFHRASGQPARKNAPGEPGRRRLIGDCGLHRGPQRDGRISMSTKKIEKIVGKAIPIPRDDIDTDRITPAQVSQVHHLRGHREGAVLR